MVNCTASASTAQLNLPPPNQAVARCVRDVRSSSQMVTHTPGSMPSGPRPDVASCCTILCSLNGSSLQTVWHILLFQISKALRCERASDLYHFRCFSSAACSVFHPANKFADLTDAKVVCRFASTKTGWFRTAGRLSVKPDCLISVSTPQTVTVRVLPAALWAYLQFASIRCSCLFAIVCHHLTRPVPGKAGNRSVLLAWHNTPIGF